MRVGGVLVQRGTEHAWTRRSEAPRRMAFILVAAAPL
jgi:hypothetical protein